MKRHLTRSHARAVRRLHCCLQEACTCSGTHRRQLLLAAARHGMQIGMHDLAKVARRLARSTTAARAAGESVALAEGVA